MEKQKQQNNIQTLGFDYFQKKSKFKSLETKLAILKNEFMVEADKVFSKNKCNELIIKNTSSLKEDTAPPFLMIKKSQRAQVIFSVEKLEASVDKKYIDKIIDKTYTVNDVLGLAAYVKECGGDPKIFKSFLNVSKNVNVKEIERLEGIGKLDSEVAKSCCTVKLGEATYNITVPSRETVYGEDF